MGTPPTILSLGAGALGKAPMNPGLMKLIGFSGFVRRMVIVKSSDNERFPAYLGSLEPFPSTSLLQLPIP
jgi:hypothetical protein